MKKLPKAKSIRPFIGAKNFSESRDFYTLLGCEEIRLGDKLSLFKFSESALFLLQDYYVKEWAENSMLMLEVEDIQTWYDQFKYKGVALKLQNVRFTPITEEAWRRVFYLHDPSGNLWHFCQFKRWIHLQLIPKDLVFRKLRKTDTPGSKRSIMVYPWAFSIVWHN